MPTIVSDPGWFLGRRYADVMAAANHQICRAEDYGVLLAWAIFRHGSAETRSLVARALFADLPRRRRRLLARHSLRAALQWSSGGPDLLLYAEDITGFGPGGVPRSPILVVAEFKRLGGRAQACQLKRLLARSSVDDTLAPGVDLQALVDANPDEALWQVDTYALVPESYMGVYSDLHLRPTDAAFIFFTGSPTATVASSYEGAFSGSTWSTIRWDAVASRIRPLLGAGVFGDDEDRVALWVALLDVPWHGPGHPTAGAPLLPRSSPPQLRSSPCSRCRARHVAQSG